MAFSRIDLHVHSSHSENADNNLLKTLGVNECYTPPKTVYNIAKARGMDWVTLTDHDTISGALELAHLDDFFISEEITTYFPQDRGKIHVVALNVTEAQHAEFQKIRENVYDLVAYLNDQNITHILAHPFFGMSTVLSMDHIEKMMLLFKNVEVKNGGKQLPTDTFMQDIVERLTPRQLWQWAEKHDIQPVGDKPWRKNTVAGSDDHGGILITCPHTILPKAESIDVLLHSINNGEAKAAGNGGTFLSVSHQVLSVVNKFANERIKTTSLKQRLASHLVDNIFGGRKAFDLLSMPLRLMLQAPLSESVDTLRFSTILRRQVKSDKTLRAFLLGNAEFSFENNQNFFDSINTTVNTALREAFSEKRQTETISQKLKVVLQILPLMAPYVIACKTEYGDRPLMRQAAKQLLPNGMAPTSKTAIFSDEPAAGVLTDFDMQTVLVHEQQQPHTLSLFCLGTPTVNQPTTFQPIPLHIQPGQVIALPPILKVIESFINQDITKVYVHTLGPMGLLGFLLGKLVDIPVVSNIRGEQLDDLLQNLARSPKYLKMGKKALKYFYQLMEKVHLLTTGDALKARELQLSERNLVWHDQRLAGKSTHSVYDVF